jgi:O-acetyl-ADP-ribose deacetylase (regulator of RNase III)
MMYGENNQNIDDHPLINRVKLVMGDITEQSDVDAIVSTIGPDLDCSGTLNSSIIKKAGEQLDEFILDNIYKPQAGDVFAVPAFNVPVDHIIYTVTPDWRDELNRDNRSLLRCYRRPMRLARNMAIKSIAFPALGIGKFRYQPDRAARLAIEGIMARIDNDFDEVRIVCNNKEIYKIFKKKLLKICWSEY